MGKIALIISGLVIGLAIGYALVFFRTPSGQPIDFFPSKKQVIGFLPYWLLAKAKTDYSSVITTLTYFGLTIDTDGTLVKRTNPRELEPGWYALEGGKADPFFAAAKAKGLTLSLAVFNGVGAEIDRLIGDPIPHAKNLIETLAPIMDRYGFTDLNLDIESTKESTPAARVNFVSFVQTIREGLPSGVRLSIDVSPTDFVKHTLINPSEVAPFVDHMIVMGYDYHYIGSLVTGPVAPLGGAGIVSEFDIQTAVTEAGKTIATNKLILGVPLYGYEWETIDPVPRSAVIPRTGGIASNFRAEQFLSTCATCSAAWDADAKESYVMYKDTTTGTFHQLFYPNETAMAEKIRFSDQARLGGIALWALGYEGTTILQPLAQYKKSVYFFY